MDLRMKIGEKKGIKVPQAMRTGINSPESIEIKKIGNKAFQLTEEGENEGLGCGCWTGKTWLASTSEVRGLLRDFYRAEFGA